VADGELWVPDSVRKTARPESRGLTLDSDVKRALTLGRNGAVDDPTLNEMRHNRRVNSKIAAQSAPSLSFATGRPKDPMFYWRQNNLPYDVNKPEELAKIRAYCRLLYMTHPIIASAIDIYSKFPLTGMELVCKDDQLTEFYSTLFLDQLKYPKFLKTLAREYWTVGEAWPMGSFNETLGVWEADELLNPDDIFVHQSPFLSDPSYEMRLPETLRRVLQDRRPTWEYDALVRSYPELENFLGENARMPVSSVLLRQIKFDADTFNPRGVPILMRGFRAVMQEEMLNAAQDAIADRLYTPLILAKLGASAADLGTNSPWVPTEADLANFEESLDAALAADFRVLTHHFAVDMSMVFGREQMPRFDTDFERLTERQLQVFGLSKTMISGGSAGETYAADALNRDLISMLLTDLQELAIEHYKSRALIVAEAQEHFDFEERGGKRYPIMEEVLEVDEETGQQRIVEKPKLLIPDMRIKSMNMKDEEKFRQFIEAARESGVPISMKTRMVNVPVDLEEEREAVIEEQVQQAVDAAKVRKRTYEGLRDENLPIPEDLEAEFRPKAITGEGDAAQPASEGGAIPTLGTVEPTDDAALVPDAAERAALDHADEAGAKVVTLPRNKVVNGDGQARRPPESDEMRAGMPRASSKMPSTYVDHNGFDREVTKEAPLVHGPRHMRVGRRSLDKDVPLDEQVGQEKTG
jgi:hypothetical protein